MHTITLQKIERISWGRNGSFRADTIDIRDYKPAFEGAEIELCVYSSKIGKHAPIKLALSHVDARELGYQLWQLSKA
jgi:hypothetical protein